MQDIYNYFKEKKYHFLENLDNRKSFYVKKGHSIQPVQNARLLTRKKAEKTIESMYEDVLNANRLVDDVCETVKKLQSNLELMLQHSRLIYIAGNNNNGKNVKGVKLHPLSPQEKSTLERLFPKIPPNSKLFAASPLSTTKFIENINEAADKNKSINN